MICVDCRNDYHEGCRGGTWCPCQHRGQKPVDEMMARAELVEYYSSEHRVAMAVAATELTQLAQEMGFEDDYEAALKMATEGGTVENL